ncbi:MAG: MarC family NAAT transporter [Phycisphaerales bacterium]
MTPTQAVKLFLFHLAALFPLVNPFDTVPLFLAVTRRSTASERATTAFRACFVATLMMLATLFVGHALMTFLEVSLSSVRIAGGLISVALGFMMLFQNQEVTSEKPAVDRGPDADYALMPLAFPSLCGAGVMAILMSISARISEATTLTTRAWDYGVAIAAILVVGALSWVILRSSLAVSTKLGSRGIDALAKLMGMVLVCIGVQLVATGVAGFITDPPKPALIAV